MFLKWALMVGGAVLVFGCADPVEDAKKTLQAGLLKNLEVEYRNLQSFPGGVVCGEMNAFDRWGSGVGYRRFIVQADQVSSAPSENDWAIFCSDDPASAFHTRFGIDLMSGKNTAVQTVQGHLTELDIALHGYLADNSTFPSTTQELVSVNTSDPQANKPAEGRSYIDKVPEDPWGRPYHYERLRRLHPAPKAYKLYTLGRDGVAGGTGEDADLGSWQLKYLDHIANL